MTHFDIVEIHFKFSHKQTFFRPTPRCLMPISPKYKLIVNTTEKVQIYQNAEWDVYFAALFKVS